LQSHSFKSHDIFVLNNVGEVLFTKIGLKASEVFLDTNELPAGYYYYYYYVYVKNENGIKTIPFIKTK